MPQPPRRTGSAVQPEFTPTNPAELIVIGGATGTGKTALSLDVAEQLERRGHRAEIINADAMQCYRGMDIGTAKLPLYQRRGIPHHGFDLLDVTETATVADYQQFARATITEVISRGGVPILVGGSGLYIASVIFDLQFPGRDPVIRAALELRLEREGPGILYRELETADPVAATSIDPANGRRIVRALEAIEVTGKPFSAQLPDQEQWWRPTAMVLAEIPRPELVFRLDRRVEDMWRDGILTETEALTEKGLRTESTAGKAIGYAQAIDQLRGDIDQAEAIARAQQLTRKFARRQVSWFRRYETALRLRADDPWAAERVLEHAGFLSAPAAPE